MKTQVIAALVFGSIAAILADAAIYSAFFWIDMAIDMVLWAILAITIAWKTKDFGAAALVVIAGLVAASIDTAFFLFSVLIDAAFVGGIMFCGIWLLKAIRPKPAELANERLEQPKTGFLAFGEKQPRKPIFRRS